MAPPGYQGWHVGKEDASTGETLSCPCLLQQGGDGWYKAEPKSNRAWEGVGWGHSTVDVGDNITPMEGRTPAVGVSKEGKDGRIAESFKRPYVFGNFGRDYVILDTEFPQESRVRENLMHGLTRGEWKPGMVVWD